MRSNYKKLGQFIRDISVKNKDLNVELLLGVSITKRFITSIANTVGTDMSKYKIVKRHQFAYGPVTSRNGEKISVALLNEDECLVSTSYTVFEIVDTDQLDPEYLMMWFRRSEFDRYARYMSHGTVRELFGWEEMCDVELPIPAIEKQWEIVREYNVVNDHIVLNEQLTQKLEATAQAIYKQWFVDFEFPITKEYAESIGKPELEGKPYKSSGGNIESCEELKVDIPAIWKTHCLDDVLELIIDHRGKTPLKLGGQWSSSGFPAISAKNIKKGKIVQRNTIRFVNDELYEKWMKVPLQTDDLIMTSEAPMGELLYVGQKTDFLLSQRLYAFRTIKSMISGYYLYYWMLNPLCVRDMEGRASGTTVLGIKQSELRKVKILKPDLNTMNTFSRLVAPIFKQKENIENRNVALEDLRNILFLRLSRI